MNTVKSAARVLELLELLAASPVPLGVSEIARRLGSPKSSASALLTTLAARGYAARAQGGLYSLDPGLNGRWVGGAIPHIVSVARPSMQALVDRTGETSYVGVLTPDWNVQYVEKVVSPQAVRYDSDIAAPRAAYNISTGLVLLAFKPPADVARYLARLEKDATARRAIGSSRRFRRELDRVRAEGYAVSIGRRVVGASGIAAPVSGHDGRVVAALNVTAPTARFEAVRTQMTEGVLWAAKEISRLLQLGPAVTPMRRGGR